MAVAPEGELGIEGSRFLKSVSLVWMFEVFRGCSRSSESVECVGDVLEVDRVCMCDSGLRE